VAQSASWRKGRLPRGHVTPRPAIEAGLYLVERHGDGKEGGTDCELAVCPVNDNLFEQAAKLEQVGLHAPRGLIRARHIEVATGVRRKPRGGEVAFGNPLHEFHLRRDGLRPCPMKASRPPTGE
jgi:hypothetical protein